MGTIRLLAGPVDLLRCRFATSPLWETGNAIRAFAVPRSRPYVQPWWDRVRDRRPAPELLALHEPRGYVPDFTGQPPQSPDPQIEAELEAVRTTPPDRVAAELRRCRDDRRDPRARELIDALLADPADARHRLADALEAAWRTLVLPWWPQIRDLLDADIAHRSRQLAREGLGNVIAALDDRISFSPDGPDGSGAIVVRTGWEGERDLAGTGLVLMPSAFTWPNVAVMLDPPWQPTLIYPARGIADLLGPRLTEPSAALVRLLGQGRARILTALDTPASTTALSTRYGMSASGVSAHLSALYATGLVGKRRHGHEVRYVRTALGQALLESAGDGITGVLRISLVR